MTKLIAALILALVLFGGWKLFEFWDKTKNEDEQAQKQAAAEAVVYPEQLAGLPDGLRPSLDAAQKQGAAGLKNWLKTYGQAVQDPRKAWIELDYCVAIFRENPAEARRIFADVKERTPPASRVYPRIKQLEKTFQ